MYVIFLFFMNDYRCDCSNSWVRIINSGGFGTVVELIENATNTHYAGKMMQYLTEINISRFDREVGRLQRFSHPRIVKLKEVLTIDNSKVMVMELGGKSLAEIVYDYTERKVLMPREDVYRVMEDIASALELMHNHESGRTAHGDIKMENILIDADGHAKLCDFGAAESENVSISRSVMTMMYVSPERMNSRTGRATCEADVWSLGVVLFWLLFGEPPFTSENPPQLIREITSFKATAIPNSCGEEERALLMRMMDPVCIPLPIEYPSFSLFLLSFSQSAETRVTCRQLCRGKSFRCIVNTIEGMWKLLDEEQARRMKAEQEKKKAEEAKEQAESEKAKLSDKVKRTVKELEDAREGRTKSEREKRERTETMEQTQATIPTAWDGTESLQTLDRTTHSLTPTTLTQIVASPPNLPWRTAFTGPIQEGEWELKIRTNGSMLGNVRVFFSLLIFSELGFLRHPLPETAILNSCGAWTGGIGGEFVLCDGSMWQAREFKPAGTNKKCVQMEETAAIRVNMSTREARLFVDDEEQPEIFTNIPSSLCLGITTGWESKSVGVLWLKRLREHDELQPD
ncbi:putative Carbon catabolite-derepressing protein kinase [Blattamonas nauphoetae]|uniref:Carbon catabolite-derepressing protein kinase n=1 Tax=Blattamonas nauphoetae TaxID=2049346 RepID=A0ABQ9Y0L0_9EUKA|nr:putative Carbon catabolite-derepressing protein kinase [Blattamonas nauphoetae]